MSEVNAKPKSKRQPTNRIEPIETSRPEEVEKQITEKKTAVAQTGHRSSQNRHFEGVLAAGGISSTLSLSAASRTR